MATAHRTTRDTPAAPESAQHGANGHSLLRHTVEPADAPRESDEPAARPRERAPDAPAARPRGHSVAAPPDDGGELGAYTRPEDALQYVGKEYEEGAPSLHYFPPRPHDRRKGYQLSAALVVGMIASLVILTLIFVYAC